VSRVCGQLDRIAVCGCISGELRCRVKLGLLAVVNAAGFVKVAAAFR
jgi:hypothetical protein